MAKAGPAVLTRGVLLLLIGVLLFFGVGRLIESAEYLGYLATSATEFDVWGVLSISAALLSVTAVAGAGVALWRGKLTLALGFALLAAPMNFVIEASRCDTVACRLIGWAALPAEAFDWKLRIRPVTDVNEARAIASAALLEAGFDNSAFRAKQMGDHWIVSSIDQDGWPGARAVRIETRSAETSLVACPADKIQCGMERPTVSDGRKAFRNEGLGLTATFPGGRPVCTARGDDDAPRGFIAMMREPDIPCEIVDSSRQMGVEVARSHKKGCLSLEAPSLPWRPLSRETSHLFENPAPTLGGRPALVCELHDGDDIQISVLASVPTGSPAKPASETLYEGYIVTTSDHLAEDIRSFEVFLEGLRISSPAEART